jgi:hypothetical protein
MGVFIGNFIANCSFVGKKWETDIPTYTFRIFSFKKTQLKIMYIANNTLNIRQKGGFPLSPSLEMFLFY